MVYVEPRRVDCCRHASRSSCYFATATADSADFFSQGRKQGEHRQKLKQAAIATGWRTFATNTLYTLCWIYNIIFEYVHMNGMS